MSRIAMNMPNTMTRKAISRCGWMRSAWLAVSAKANPGTAFAVVFAMALPSLCSVGVGAHRGAAHALRGNGRVRFGIHTDDHRHAGPQYGLLGDHGRDQNADRQPLHDLGKIAGGVVGR